MISRRLPGVARNDPFSQTARHGEIRAAPASPTTKPEFTCGRTSESGAYYNRQRSLSGGIWAARRMELNEHADEDRQIRTAAGTRGVRHTGACRGPGVSASFHVQEIPTDGAVIDVRIGGKGPAVVMLHGFGDTGDLWAPVAAVLVQGRTVVVPDLREWVSRLIRRVDTRRKHRRWTSHRVLNKLQIEKADLVTHDIGNMVGYAFAAQFPARVTRWGVIDAPLPGNRSLGRDSYTAPPCALQFPRARCRTPGQGPRTHLPRPVLE